MCWYVYGLTDADSEEFEVTRGLDGHPVRVLGVGPVRLLASRAPDGIDDLVAAQPDDVRPTILEHEDVVAQLASTRTVAPARFGTLLADDEAVDSLLADPDGLLAAQVERVAGAAEWVVSVTVTTDGTHEDSATGDDVITGQEVLVRQRASTEVRRRAVAFAQHLDADLRRFARDVASLDPRGPDMVARGAYLVSDVDVCRMGEIIDAEGSAAAVQVQGPLPAYRFAEVGA